MLKENIKAIRKAKGFSQEELASRLHVVRQTVSKWEQGLSVPDSDLLIALSEVLETPVSTLLGETVSEPAPDDLKVLSEKLERINLQLAGRKERRQRVLHGCFLALCAMTAVIFAGMLVFHSAYLGWDYTSPETAVMGVGLHAFEWLFVRTAPFVFAAGVAGAVVTRKKRGNGFPDADVRKSS